MVFEGLTYGFDLPIMSVLQGSDSLFLDNMVFTLTNALMWIPLYVAIVYMIIHNNATMMEILTVIGMTLAVFGFIDIVIDIIVKPSVMRYRPTQEPLLKYTIDVVRNYRGGLYGFFSAHAANTMGIAVFISLVVRSGILTTALVLWSILNGYTRIYLGVHYPSDVLIGWIFGLVSGTIFYFIYKYTFRRLKLFDANYISTKYTSTGYAMFDIYIVILVLLLTIFTSMIIAFII